MRPLRLLIKGTAGTGKSFVIDRITDYIEEVRCYNEDPAKRDDALLDVDGRHA